MRSGISHLLILSSLCAATGPISAESTSEWEQDFRGVLDIRATQSDTLDSYPTGGHGRFRFSDGSSLNLSQASLKYTLTHENWSLHTVGTAYLDNENDGLGITEAFVRYRGVPDSDGLRHTMRLGVIYPQISMENIATAWLSPYTLSFATQNTWIGEEVRHIGFEWGIDLLGRSRGDNYDLNLTATAFKHNDTNGALLAWHGWTLSSRQSLWGESLRFPVVPAMSPGRMLEIQAPYSDPFVELDSNFGFHVKLDWRWDKKLRLRVGHYDNQAEQDIVINGQYTWQTQFSHLGLEWRLDKQTTILGQYMTGDTRMRVVDGLDVVGLDFTNSFILVSHKSSAHRYTVRYEQFNNEDFDGIQGDNNDDQGDALTLGYQYDLGGGVFMLFEYNQISSLRPGKVYQNLPINEKESQYQAGLRYFF